MYGHTGTGVGAWAPAGEEKKWTLINDGHTDIGFFVIRITGDRCLEVLSKLFPVDVRPAAFPTGQLRMTGHHHVPAALHRTGPQAFDIYVFTTYALDQLQALEDAALEYGVAVEV